jgi:hypothetical protein
LIHTPFTLAELNAPLASVVFCVGAAMILSAFVYRLLHRIVRAKQLRINPLKSEHAGRVPLVDAARIAAESAPLICFSAPAARFGARQTDLLLFYCFQLARRVPLYGKHMLSHSVKRLSRETALDLRFSFVNSDIIATELVGQNVYIDLFIDKTSLRAAIGYLKSQSGKQAAA